MGIMYKKVTFFLLLLCIACSGNLPSTKISYNNGEFEYVPMFQGNVAHHIYISGKKNDLKDGYKLEKFCIFYAKKYKIKLTEGEPINLWLMSEEFFSMDQIHEENFIAVLALRCTQGKMRISSIAIFKNENRDYPIDYPPKNDHDSMPCQ
jgi:hypothetical protein